MRAPLRSSILAIVGAALAAASAVAAPPTEPVLRAPTVPARTPAQKKAETYAAKLLQRGQQATGRGEFTAARDAYVEAAQVLEEAYGRTHERLINPLTQIVSLYVGWDQLARKRGGRRPGNMDAAVKAALQLADIEAALPEATPRERQQAMVDAGDIQLYAGQEKAALDTYRKVWKLVEEGSDAESADGEFRNIVPVRLLLPDNYAGHQDWTFTLKFDVGTSGEVSGVEVTSDAPNKITNEMRDLMRESLFRPRLVGGEPAATPGATLLYRYAADGSAPAELN